MDRIAYCKKFYSIISNETECHSLLEFFCTAILFLLKQFAFLYFLFFQPFFFRLRYNFMYKLGMFDISSNSTTTNTVKIPSTLACIIPSINNNNNNRPSERLLDNFLTGCFQFGIQRIYLFLSDEISIKYLKSKINPILLGENGEDGVVRVVLRKPTEISSYSASNNFEEFIKINAPKQSDIQLIISYIRGPLNLYGLSPLSLTNSEFSECFWAEPFSLCSLAFSLHQYALCNQRFGK